MKTLTNHVIVFDNDCPMCKLYTGAFVKTKMLDHNGRQAYTDIDDSVANTLDKQRACDEIALVNTTSGHVTYGIESLFKILAHRFPLLRIVFRVHLFKWAMTKIYSLISYNRKIIAPAKTFESYGSCTPAFNLRYRIVYLVVTWMITSGILHAYSRLLFPLLPVASFSREILICGGQIVFQTIAVFFLRKERLMHYLGNMMTVSMIGVLALLPAMLMARLGVSSPLFFLIWFCLIVSGMLMEHVRRVRLLNIHWSASASWVLYRIIILTVMLSL